MMTIDPPSHHHPTFHPQRHPHRTSSPTTARRPKSNLNSSDYTGNTLSSSPSFLSLPSATLTTLSQRLRRAIIHDDLPLAQRIAAQATLLAQTPHSRHLPRDLRGPVGRQWMKQRHTLRTYGEECLVPQGQTSIIDGLKRYQGSLKFDIRNVDRISESKEQNSPLYASSIRYSPLAGEKVPRPCYPLDCTIPEQDATKTSIHLAIEYQCSLDLIEWILRSGHETGDEYQVRRYSSHDGRVRERGNFLPTRDRYGRTIFHLATIFNRCDVLELYHSHLSELLDTLSHPQQEVESRRPRQDSSPDGHSETRSISSLSADSHSSAYAGPLGQVDNPDEQDFRMTLSRSSHHQQIDGSHDVQEPQQQDGEEVLIDKHRKSSDSLALSVESISTQDDDDEARSTILSLIRATDGLSGATALHEACSRGLEDAGRILLSLGASIDATDACGNTPLHYASSNGHPACVQLLIEKGAIFGLRNHAGFSPADVAFTNADRATLEALGRDSLVQKKEKRKEERLARVVLAAERASLGRGGNDTTITDENDKMQTPAVISWTANGGSGGPTASPGRPESSPLPPFARSTSALSIRKYPWYLDEGEGFQNLPSPAMNSPRSRLASFSRMASRNSTLISSPISPTLPPPPIALADGRESSVLRLARRSSSALRSWAIGYGRATSPALGSHSSLACAAAATLDASATEPTTPTFPYASSISSGSPALHLQKGEGSIVPTTHTATAVSSPASTTVLPSPKLLPRSGLSTTPFPRIPSNSPTSHPFRLLTTTRSTTSLASSFLRPNRPCPGARPRSIDIDSLRIGFNFLSGTGVGSSSTGTVGEGGGGARVSGANAAGAGVGNGLGSPDDSGTEELATPTTPYDRDGLGRYFAPSGVGGGGAYIPSSSSISLSSNSNQQSQLLVHRHQQQQAQQPHQQRNFSGEAMHARPRGGSVGPSHTGGSQSVSGWGDILGDTASTGSLEGAPLMVRKRSNSAQINSPSASPSLMMVYGSNVSQAISPARKEESASLSCRPLRHIQHGVDLGEEGFGSTAITLGSVGSMSSTISSTSSLTLTGRDHSFGSINTASTSRHEQNQGGHPSPQGSVYHDEEHGDEYDHFEGGYAAPFNTPREEEEEEEREICSRVCDAFRLSNSTAQGGEDIHGACNMRAQDKTSFEDQTRFSQALDADARAPQRKAEVSLHDQYTSRPIDAHGSDVLPTSSKSGNQKYPLPLPLPLPRRSSRRIRPSGAGAGAGAGEGQATQNPTMSTSLPINNFAASASASYSSSPRGLVGCSEEAKESWSVKDLNSTRQSLEESLHPSSSSMHSSTSTMHLKRGGGGGGGGGGISPPHPANLNPSSTSNSTSTSTSKEADPGSNLHSSTSTSMGMGTGMMTMMVTSPSPPVRPPRRRHWDPSPSRSRSSGENG